MTLRSLLSLILVLLAPLPALAQTSQADKVDDYIKAEMQKRRAMLDQMRSAAKLADGNVFRFGGTTGYAHGWVVDDSGGGSTAYWRFLDDKLNVVVLTNLQGSDPDSLAQGVAALYVPEIIPEIEGKNGQ